MKGNSSNSGTHGNAKPRVATTTTTTSSTLSNATLGRSNSYRYGTGGSTRNYRASGYGRGYRNRYYGNSGNYGRSQTNDRSLVARLRSVHATLARIDHDYRGHRARANHHIALAIRHLSHRSIYSNASAASGVAGRSNIRLTGANGNANRQRNQLTQAQSDSRMSQALRTTQGVTTQLTQQGQYHSSHRLAYLRLQRAMHEMNQALTVR